MIMKKFLLSAVLGATLISTSLWAMEKSEDTPAARAAYLQRWEQGSPDNLEEYVHKNFYGEPNRNFAYTTTFDLEDKRPVVISSHLLQALLEREGQMLADPDGDIKIVSFSHKGKSFELRLKKNNYLGLPPYIECGRSDVYISGSPNWEQVPGWVVSQARLSEPATHLIFSIRPLENLDAQ